MSEQVSSDTWILISFFLVLSFYSCFAAAVWPYARPFLPVWLILLAFFFPPALFFLAIYILIFALYIPPTIAVVEKGRGEEFVVRRV